MTKKLLPEELARTKLVNLITKALSAHEEAGNCKMKAEMEILLQQIWQDQEPLRIRQIDSSGCTGFMLLQRLLATCDLI